MNIEIEKKKSNPVEHYKNKTEYLHIRCTQAQKSRAEEQARRMEMTLSQYVLYLIKQDADK